MKEKTVTGIMLALLLIGMINMVFSVCLEAFPSTSINQNDASANINSQNTFNTLLIDTLADGSKEKNLTFDRLNQRFFWETKDVLGFNTHGGKAIPVIDIDNDEQNEFLLGNAIHENSFVGVFRNFTCIAELPYTGWFNEVTVGDSDNDGLNEILVATSSGQVFLYNSSYMLEDAINIPGSNLGSVTVGDSDGDGRNEVLIADYVNGLCRVFEYDSVSSSYVASFNIAFPFVWDVKVKYLVHGATGPGNSLVLQGGGVAKAFLYYDSSYHEKVTINTGASSRPYKGSESNIVIEDVTNEGESKLVVGKNVYRPLTVGHLEFINSLSVLDPQNQVTSTVAGYIPHIGNVIALGTATSFEIHWWDGNNFRRIYSEYDPGSNAYGCYGVGIGDVNNDGIVEILRHRVLDGRYIIYSLKKSCYDETVYLKIPKNAVIKNATVDIAGYKGQIVVAENFGTTLETYAIPPVTPPWGQSFQLKNDVDLAIVSVHIMKAQFNSSYVEVEIKPTSAKANTSRLVEEEEWYDAVFYPHVELNAGEQYALYLRSFGYSNVHWYGTWKIGYHYRLYEERYPTNPYLDVGDSGLSWEWSHNGEFDEFVSLQTVDLNATIISNYSATAPLDSEDNVLVPLSFHSDSAGMIEVSNIKISYLLDTTPPTGSVLIAGGSAYINSSLVTLALYAYDGDSGVAQMRLSHDNVTWTSWENFTTARQWAFTAGDGTKIVYVQYMDKVGLVSASYYDTITLDLTKPVSNAGSNQTVKVGVIVTFNASGSTDNIDIVSYEWDFGDGTTGEGFTTNHSYMNLGTYTVTLTVRDVAGNTDTDSIAVTVLPEIFPWWIVGAIVIVIVTAVVGITLWRRRRRSSTE